MHRSHLTGGQPPSLSLIHRTGPYSPQREINLLLYSFCYCFSSFFFSLLFFILNLCSCFCCFLLHAWITSVLIFKCIRFELVWWLDTLDTWRIHEYLLIILLCILDLSFNLSILPLCTLSLTNKKTLKKSSILANSTSTATFDSSAAR